MSLINTLATEHDVHQCIEQQEWFEFTIETPAHRFNNFIHEVNSAGLIILFLIRGEYDRKQAIDFMSFINTCESSIQITDTIKKIENIMFDTMTMDAAIFLGPDFHSSFKADMPGIHQKTILCFPIYHCEFDGYENADEIMVMRKDFVPTLCWDRDPCPKIRCRFNNPRTKGGTIGKKLGLIDIGTVINEMIKLSGVSDGFIELSNCKNKSIRIISNQIDSYEVFNDKAQRIFCGNYDKTIEALKAFLIDAVELQKE